MVRPCVFHFKEFILDFVYIFRTAWSFTNKFRSSDPSFDKKILSAIYLEFEISAHAQIEITRY